MNSGFRTTSPIGMGAGLADVSTLIFSSWCRFHFVIVTNTFLLQMKNAMPILSEIENDKVGAILEVAARHKKIVVHLVPDSKMFPQALELIGARFLPQVQLHPCNPHHHRLRCPLHRYPTLLLPHPLQNPNPPHLSSHP